MAETEEQMDQPLRQEHPMDLQGREARLESSLTAQEHCTQEEAVAAEAAVERPGVLLGPEEV